MNRASRAAWTRTKDIKARLAKRWKKGEFLSAEAPQPDPLGARTPQGEPPSGDDGAGSPQAKPPPDASLFPLRLKLKGPTSSEMLEHFDEVRAWVQELERAEARAPFALEWKSVDHRQLGRNRVPEAVSFDDCDSLASFLGEHEALETFRTLAARVVGRHPVLAEWVARYPFELLEHADSVDRLLEVVTWLAGHPRPGIYIRQMSLPGIDTKFVESHRRILAQWLDPVLPPEAVDTRYSGVRGFETRYGFRTRPEIVRFRLLDERLAPAAGGYTDLTVPMAEFCRQPPGGGPAGVPEPGGIPDFDSPRSHTVPITDVFVTENDINGLSLPDRERSIVLFGRGYHFASLAAARWLHNVRLWYWGDIDTHGFAILSEFRSHFPHARSLFMDRETLLAHEPHWGSEPKPVTVDLRYLTTQEHALFDDLRSNRYAERLRLEQEFVNFSYVMRSLEQL